MKGRVTEGETGRNKEREMLHLLAHVPNGSRLEQSHSKARNYFEITQVGGRGPSLAFFRPLTRSQMGSGAAWTPYGILASQEVAHM